MNSNIDRHDCTVIIPTLSNDPITTDSIPDDVPVRIEREGTLNEARNRGVENADTEYVIILDDDLRFSAELIGCTRARLDDQTLIGIADWDFGLIAGRVMAFHRDLWRDVGGFDERLGSHMGDTEFALSVAATGYNFERLPREIVFHEPHERSISTMDRVKRLAYLAAKYPRSAPSLAAGVLR